MNAPPEPVRRFYEARARSFSEPYQVIGVGMEMDQLPQPDDYVEVPSSVLEACGFYFLNVLQRDNGSVYVFRADANGTPTLGVLATSDGSDRALEVYGSTGELLGAALVEHGAVAWQERAAVRCWPWGG
jgi:hypothetical protein